MAVQRLLGRRVQFITIILRHHQARAFPGADLEYDFAYSVAGARTSVSSTGKRRFANRGLPGATYRRLHWAVRKPPCSPLRRTWCSCASCTAKWRPYLAVLPCRGPWLYVAKVRLRGMAAQATLALGAAGGGTGCTHGAQGHCVGLELKPLRW